MAGSGKLLISSPIMIPPRILNTPFQEEEDTGFLPRSGCVTSGLTCHFGERLITTAKSSLVVILLCVAQSTAAILDTLVIEGLSINRQGVVRNAAALEQGQDFAPADIQRAIKSLYRLGLFSQVEFRVIADTDSSASLVVELKEYPVCESIEYSGLKKMKEKDFDDVVALHEGSVVSDVLLFRNIRAIKNKYAEEGYLLADISCDLIETKVPGNVIARFRIKEGRKVRVREVVFKGNIAVEEKRLKRKFKTKEKRWFNAGEFDEDLYGEHLDSLMLFYYDEGYLDGRVEQDSVRYGENLRDIYIEIEVFEGHRYYVGDFFFTGNKVLEDDALANRVAMKRGKPFNRSKFEMTKHFIGGAYREEGYLWVQVEEQNRYRNDTIDVTFSIVEGRPAIVRKIDIAGNGKTREKVIRREFQIYPGQKYKQSRMERSIREVMQLNYFDNVLPDLRPHDDGTIDLIYRVEEKENVGQFSMGMMYSQIDGFGGNFSITIPNFRGAGQQLDASVEYSAGRKAFSVGFSEPWIFDTPTSFNVRGFVERQTRVDDEYRSAGIEFGVGRRLKWPDDYFRVYGNYRLSYERDFLFSTRAPTGFVMLREGILSRLRVTLVRNDTDVPNFPNRGSNFSASTSLAGLGGDYYFVKGIVDYDWYFPLWWKFVLGAKSKMGLVEGLGSKNTISRSDLFAAGGVYYDGQIRGYGEGSFGGIYVPERGVAILTFTGELRFPLLEQQLYLSLFGDMGNTWGSLARVDPGDLYTGVGFGLRLMLPMVGLMGFDFAWGLNDPYAHHLEDNYSPSFQLHFLMNKGF